MEYVEKLKEAVANSKSYRNVVKLMGYSPDSGSAAEKIKKEILEYNIDTSHFIGQGWNKGQYDYSRFQKGKVIKLTSALPALIALRGHQCECCGNETWNGIPITLEIHHEDGDSLNNELDNLTLICPNCHSQTENWRGKNIDKKEREPVSEEQFVEALKNHSNIRQALLSLGLAAKGGNYTRANELIVKYQITHLLK